MADDEKIEDDGVQGRPNDDDFDIDAARMLLDAHMAHLDDAESRIISVRTIRWRPDVVLARAMDI